MTNIIEQLQEPLKAHEIDFRVQRINKSGYATLIAYKDARVDMKRLDEVFGVHGWQRDYKQVGSMMLCGVSIKHEGEWITKWDTGTESSAEAVKGLASDAFKRACFNFGIGRELYDYPDLQVALRDNEWKLGSNGKPQQVWALKLKEWRWMTQFNEHGDLVFISAVKREGDRWVNRFKWGDKVAAPETSTTEGEIT